MMTIKMARIIMWAGCACLVLGFILFKLDCPHGTIALMISGTFLSGISVIVAVIATGKGANKTNASNPGDLSIADNEPDDETDAQDMVNAKAVTMRGNLIVVGITYFGYSWILFNGGRPDYGIGLIIGGCYLIGCSLIATAIASKYKSQRTNL